jgi:hypothetical protein
MEGEKGNKVFEKKFGKIEVKIWYGSNKKINWIMFGLNGDEIVLKK